MKRREFITLLGGAAALPLEVSAQQSKPMRKVVPPGDVLMAGLKQVGEQLTAEWLRKAGGDGLAAIEAYKKN